MLAKEKQASPSVKKKKKNVLAKQLTTFLLETKQTPQNIDLCGPKGTCWNHTLATAKMSINYRKDKLFSHGKKNEQTTTYNYTHDSHKQMLNKSSQTPKNTDYILAFT